MTTDLPVLTVRDVAAWHSWLTEHHGDAGGVWLVLAKKGATGPTNLTYDQALEEALCFGWVDGQLGPGDEATFRRRFTPRRPGSSWSKRNVALVELLTRQERMQPAGLVAVERAKADGSWGSAYSGQAAIEVPSDLAAALAANPAAQETFDNLSRANRYAVLYRIATAKRDETRSQRIERLVAMLARGETLHPQARPARRSP
ncbi:MAG TPA: YdeI/OmpD-associated family protein [Acidimicrobiales bacterium]|nr:YdeI/OmpD-associated family protein [Acidimicrobiales bacterium]